MLSPVEILQTIEQTVRNKLRATDSVVRAIKQDLGDYLLLRKEPFRLFTDFAPLDFQMLEALRIFTILEASLEEMAVKHLHTLPAEDRISKFECIRGLRYLTDRIAVFIDLKGLAALGAVVCRAGQAMQVVAARLALVDCSCRLPVRIDQKPEYER